MLQNERKKVQVVELNWSSKNFLYLFFLFVEFRYLKWSVEKEEEAAEEDSMQEWQKLINMVQKWKNQQVCWRLCSILL